MKRVEKPGRRRPPRFLSAKFWTLPVAVLMVASVSSRGAADHASAMVERRAWAMGTRLSITVEAADRGTAVKASEAALLAVAEVEARLSTWVNDSELSRFNRAGPGVDIRLSQELEFDLREASHWWRETRGAFDPGIASLVVAWDVRGRGREPSETELKAATSSAGLGHLLLGSGVARSDVTGFGLEEGGFGKGVALRHAAAAARANGADCVVLDFGGQFEIAGDCGDRSVDIARPDHRGGGLARLILHSGSVATSGNSERGLMVDGIRRGHILDPRSGRPATDWGSVTVVASDPVAADCLSTALFVMGPQRGAEWLRGRPEVDAVLIERREGRTDLIATPGLKGRLDVFENGVTYLLPAEGHIEKLSKKD